MEASGRPEERGREEGSSSPRSGCPSSRSGRPNNTLLGRRVGAHYWIMTKQRTHSKQNKRYSEVS